MQHTLSSNSDEKMMKVQQQGETDWAGSEKKVILSATMANAVPVVAVWGECYAVWAL